MITNITSCIIIENGSYKNVRTSNNMAYLKRIYLHDSCCSKLVSSWLIAHKVALDKSAM